MTTTPELSAAQHDRAAGVLLTAAAGDALGVPYEFATPPPPGVLAAMTGGGLGDFAPGEWSDDTSMAMAIAQVAATGADLTTAAALDRIAANFLTWYDAKPADIGIQTSAVLHATRLRRPAASGTDGLSAVMAEEAGAYARRNPRSAGNGALMRTAPVALAHLGDRARCAEAARAVAALTHADSLAGDSCVLWCEAIRVAVREGRFDVAAGLDLIPADRREEWTAWLAESTSPEALAGPVPGARFTPNGFTVAALQAATAAILGTPVPDDEPCLHLQDALHNAVRIGNDTDTVAAIAGALLGARWGASAVPWRWRRAVHGWPGLDAVDAVALASLAARGGRSDRAGWPTAPAIDYWPEFTEAIPHPYDAGVLLGTSSCTDHGADAVVSLCRVGRDQPCFGGATEIVESRLIDSDDPAANPHLSFVLRDAAEAVRGLRAEGKRVFLHCVAAQQRTPSVAVAYAVLLGYDGGEARRAVRGALPSARGYGRVWDAADLGVASSAQNGDKS